MDPFDLLITCDVETDFKFLPDRDGRRGISFQGVDQGLPLYLEYVDELEKEFGIPIHQTFFLRCDDQIREMRGNAAYLINRHKTVWKLLERKGNLIAFHPHLYARFGFEWKLEPDPHRLSEQLVRSYAAFQQEGFGAKISRIGEAYRPATLFEMLTSLGIECDSTAIPFLNTVRDGFPIDWSDFSSGPVRIKTGENSTLLEVPFSIMSVKAPYDQTLRKRYINPAYYRQYFEQSIETYLKEHSHCLMIFHLHEIVPGEFRHQLISYDVKELACNLRKTVDCVRRIGKIPRFLTLQEFKDLY